MSRALLTFFEVRQLRQPPVPRPEVEPCGDCDGPDCICTIARAVTPLPYPAPAQAVAR